MSTSVMAVSADEILIAGITNPHVNYQLTPDELIEQSLQMQKGVLNNTGALCIETGEFTGRSPDDKFIVNDETVTSNINWGGFNNKIDEKYFFILRDKILKHLDAADELWVRDVYACADKNYRLNIRVINENPADNLFIHNMFIQPETVHDFQPDWQILHAPGFYANPSTDCTRQKNFSIISFKHKTVLIGGTGYTGEMKKGVFTILNYLLPVERNVLSMHCSANIGDKGDVAIFFGLSGTGKTTLSADESRKLIGDDEHGWTDKGVFNFEGGCYAKCINLSAENEPQIYNAIRHGALVENVGFIGDTNEIDFSSKAITENTRVSYPMHFIDNAVESGKGNQPKNIFFLTCDAYGVLPPVSKLSSAQAMYQFISGYTAKIAGTEAGVTKPKATFSTCFGAPFLPLHPSAYAEMLGAKMKEQNVNVWMINTGWIGGEYGAGSRIQLKYTRAIINAVLNGSLNKVDYTLHDIFGLHIPVKCDGVPEELLNPRNLWQDKKAYDQQAKMLAKMFADNFDKYKSKVSKDVIAAGPKAD